jgi:hypothetical protein
VKHFAVVNAAGFVLRVVQCPNDQLPAEEDPAQCVELSGWTGWPVAPHPGAQLRLVEGVRQWNDPRSLDQMRVDKNAEINAARLAANRGGFMFAGKLISTDELSRSDIDGTNGAVALTGEFPAGWPGAWKTEDNSYIPITDIETWKAFYAAMVAQGAQNFATAQALKAQLAAASTAAEIDAVRWPA